MLRAEPMRRAWRALVRCARLAVGVPDYEAYVAHLRDRHPGAVPMERNAFFAERMRARYGRGRSRCC
ncbi:MAG TPA: YbdD/YjiX family protein [Ramlibacter sp.]|nr:YbdD/YjiX family protein [Ramlibacter sp.]